MCVFVGWVDVEHGEPLAIGDSRVMVRRPVLEKHWAHPKAHQKNMRRFGYFSRDQFPNKREQGKSFIEGLGRRGIGGPFAHFDSPIMVSPQSATVGMTESSVQVLVCRDRQKFSGPKGRRLSSCVSPA